MREGKLTVWTKAAYGFGSVAFGVKNNGFDYFFLFFYSSVMGVEAGLVSLALLIALMFDALSDPLIGYFSDNTHSRWGRRHPFMYAAAVPVGLSYYFVWNPPAMLTGNELFLYIVVIAVFVRTLITAYEVPSSALVAEMTEDYDERTSALSYRYFFGWSGGTIMAAFATAYLLVPTETITNGMLNPEGYGYMGLAAAAVIFTAIVVSAGGTHHMIPHLQAAPPKREMTLGRIYRELWETLANRSFAALFLATVFASIATGLSAGLAYYINTFYWGFDNEQIALISISVVLSAMIGFVVAPAASKRLGKRNGAILVGILAFTVAPLPVTLRLFDLMPVNGDPMLFPIVLTIIVVDVGLIIAYQTLAASMIADLVEDSQRRTARRSEGVFFAAVTFTRKMVQGLGVVAAGTALTVINFPTGVMPEDIPTESLVALGVVYAPSLFVLWMIMICCLSLYGITRESHAENLKALNAETG